MVEAYFIQDFSGMLRLDYKNWNVEHLFAEKEKEKHLHFQQQKLQNSFFLTAKAIAAF